MRPRPSSFARLVAPVTWMLSAAVLLLVACDDPVKEGTARTTQLTWPSGVPRIMGVEVFHDGQWQKQGEFVFLDEEGDVTHRGSYERGLETGVWHERYEDGGTGRGAYVAGKRHGPWTYTYANGRIAQTGEYSTGERSGTWKEWSPAGEPRPDLLYPVPDPAR